MSFIRPMKDLYERFISENPDDDILQESPRYWQMIDNRTHSAEAIREITGSDISENNFKLSLQKAHEQHLKIRLRNLVKQVAEYDPEAERLTKIPDTDHYVTLNAETGTLIHMISTIELLIDKVLTFDDSFSEITKESVDDTLKQTLARLAGNYLEEFAEHGNFTYLLKARHFAEAIGSDAATKIGESSNLGADAINKLLGNSNALGR